MPYVTLDRRQDIVDGDFPMNVGELTFSLQWILRQYLENTGLRYAHLAECLGALEGAKLDLIDRVVVPYEHKKCEENGDVWPFTLDGLTLDLPDATIQS